VIANAGSLLLLTDGRLRSDPALGGSASLHNSGLLRRDSLNDPISTQVAATVAELLMPLEGTTDGKIHVDHGILRLGDTGTVSGEVLISGHDDGLGAGTLELAGTGYTFAATSTITDFIGAGPPAGEGTLRVSAGTHHIAGTFNTGRLSIEGGILVIDTPGG